jgi:hypothetical protein
MAIDCCCKTTIQWRAKPEMAGRSVVAGAHVNGAGARPAVFLAFAAPRAEREIAGADSSTSPAQAPGANQGRV